MKFRKFICLPLLIVCNFLFAQTRNLEAVKINLPPKIDGNLDEAVWQSAPIATHFIQNFPNYGLACSQKTEVRVLYDNSAIYIGAYLYDDPSMIRKQFTVRDGESQQDVDYFSVFFDTYNDDQNGFQFLVTAANVQTDARMGANLAVGFNDYGDKTWDAVWESKVSIKSDGWVVEMKIPYISLRFSKVTVQNWGINFLRHIRRNNEQSFWNPVNPQVNGFLNQFGDLRGLQNIEPPLRLSFSPYITGGIRSTPQASGYKNDFLRNGGMDIKYGINESFTVDATLIPDFGQVISDNVVNNLSPFEVKFQENRPFFTEGTELFNKAGLFYSRRIGATPSGYGKVRSFVNGNTDWEIKKNPSITQLYNAVKFSGRNKKNFGLGIFNAVTAPMHAVISNTVSGKDSVIETEQLGNYNIIVLDKAFRGQSFVTFTNASVLKRGNNRNANVSSFDYAIFSKNNEYGVSGSAKYSKIFGNENYDGYSAALKLAKISGNWQYYMLGDITSDRYDPRDMGYLAAPNQVIYKGDISYKIFKPTATFITYNYEFFAIANYLYKPYRYARTDLSAKGLLVFRNFWDVTLSGVLNPGYWHDFFELQQTPDHYLTYPLNYYITLSGSTDSRKRAFVSYGATYARTPKINTTTVAYQLGLRYRFSDRLTLSLNTDALRARNYLGNSFLVETDGSPLAAKRNIRQFTSLFSGVYNFTSRLNLTMRLRHYWSRVNFKEIYTVANDGSVSLRVPGQGIGPYINNPNYFNIDAFLTWDFRPGSRFIFGWKNWLGDGEFVDGDMYKNYLRNFNQVLQLRHANELTVRFIYFLDYNQLKRKR
ncbi:MAG: hypothetical protein GC171_00590 [Terrimonas sp.]|nr:hypothetical protein [Terrimonas sp.]